MAVINHCNFYLKILKIFVYRTVSYIYFGATSPHRWEDDFSANQLLRQRFRVTENALKAQARRDALHHLDVPLLPPSAEDAAQAQLLAIALVRLAFAIALFGTAEWHNFLINFITKVLVYGKCLWHTYFSTRLCRLLRPFPAVYKPL